MTIFKKLLPLTFALALFGMAMTGCEEDVLSGDSPAMQAEIDGDDWTATSVDATGSNSITITAAKSDGSAIILTLDGNASVDTYSFPASLANGYAAVYRPDASTNLVAATGEIEITAISESQISGTFSFDATDGSSTVEVRDGSFVANRN